MVKDIYLALELHWFAAYKPGSPIGQCPTWNSVVAGRRDFPTETSLSPV